MFENIGGKIKTLAVLVCGFGMVGSMAFGLRIMTSSSRTTEAFILGVGVIILGCLLSWVSVFLLYGFGELIEKTCSIESMMRMKQPDVTPYNNMQYNSQQYNGQQFNANNTNSVNTWQCPVCGANNMFNTTTCKKCGNARPV